ncbi:hypothetical protein ACOJD8_002379 [Cronobacter turicensis]|uniref:hypothetical protein n=1 Tax=Cronobacter turicensis TaxID=413502 RepID=UPI0011AD9999|nr:hypothetical protein [Cronobacter turicensis]ELY2743432.1 hypothetical protein [Cronobacter turicensis]ELY2785601.1 hypothetical protein [Cronobacter turicensis]ELY4855765.1 hypothetical protein [Cronobacter turicensis]MDI7407439.1 hypothetical protein [Cronobacter turicensis]TWR35007.1 hypothetical protein FQY85_08990 [Cronobacter turicensis]
MTSIGKVPDYIELLSFFESTPFLSDEQDHRFGYSYTDSNGVKLIFSYAALEGWIQTIIEFNGNIISQHLSEGITRFEIRTETQGGFLYSKIDSFSSVTRMEIRLKPQISVKWNTLLK